MELDQNLYFICVWYTTQLQTDADAIPGSAIETDKIKENQRSVQK